MLDDEDTGRGDGNGVTVIIQIPNSEPALRPDLSVLKDGKAFAIIGSDANIHPVDSNNVAGLFVMDMRHVSTLEVTFGADCALVAPGRLSADKAEFIARHANIDGNVAISSGVVLKGNTLYRAVEIRNNGVTPMEVPAHISFGGDFIDMFALRFPKNFRSVYEQYHPERRSGPLGRQRPVRKIFGKAASRMEFSCTGLDKVVRTSFASLSEKPDKVHGTGASYNFRLGPHERKTLYIEAGAGGPPADAPSAQRYADALASLRAKRRTLMDNGARVSFGDRQAQAWWDASMTDIALLTNHNDTGLYPCAGLPWFAVEFGRDGITTADELLWQNPAYAAGVLRFLASTQAKAADPDIEAEPGKIMHERRECETMFAVNPETGKPYNVFRLYYGGADTTLLFIMLAEKYYRRTGDAKLIADLWPQIEASLDWAKSKLTADGFIGYSLNGKNGLANQRMYDSEYSVFYANGDHRVAYPRKVLEIQGYAYAALKAGETFVRLAGRPEADARTYATMAANLKQAVNDKFWIPDAHDPNGGHYAHAIDGNGVLCPETSTPCGDILATGIVPPGRAASIARTLLSPAFFNGGGVRTLPKTSIRYDSNAYHNGGVWPHINSAIAWGFKLCGLDKEARTLIEANQKVAAELGGSLPELFQGDTGGEGHGFRRFDSACHPQAWSAAAVARDVQTAQMADIDALKGEVRLDPSAMPARWGVVKVENLKIGGATIGYEIEPGGLIRLLSHAGAPVTVIDARNGAILPLPMPSPRPLPPEPGPS